jgi:hypothetical protein
MKDCFISYNSADRDWAQWIAWVLKEGGKSVLIQAWDFRPGGNFVLEMQRAASGTRKTVAVLSNSYLDAEYTQPEWAAAFARDPRGFERVLVPVRIEECKPEGLLSQLIYVDLVGLSEQEAERALHAAFLKRAKPSTSPPFPGDRRAKPSAEAARRPTTYPGFPGQTG